MAAANADQEFLEDTIQQLRVCDLQVLLSAFNYPKLGRKDELIQRCIILLRQAGDRAAVVQKIGEISIYRSYGNAVGRAAPSPLPHCNPGATTDGEVLHAKPVTVAEFQSSYPLLSTSQQSQCAPSSQARSLRILGLPFYDKICDIVELTELPASALGIRTSTRLSFNFSIPPEIVPKICYRNESTSLPRMEIQLRFFAMDFGVEQSDDFPPKCFVGIDGSPVTLPNEIKTNIPNCEPKRLSRPVNITSHCQPPRDGSALPHEIVVEWTADDRSWAFGIFAVYRIHSDILLGRVVENPAAHRSFEFAKSLVQRSLTSNGEDEVQMNVLRISLLCPLGKTRMAIPVKGTDCAHLQCFDLLLYLQMNEKRPTWKCPVCGNSTPVSKLIIDGYFERVLKEVPTTVNDVELLPDGEYRPVSGCMKSILDDVEVPIKRSRASSTSYPLPIRASSALRHESSVGEVPAVNSADDDVVVIEDSDDDVIVVERSADDEAEQTERVPGMTNSGKTKWPKRPMLVALSKTSAGEPTPVGTESQVRSRD